MDDAAFETLVFAGLDQLPESFRQKINNVAFFIANAPSPRQRHEMHLQQNETLLGLYEGVPQTERSIYYHLALPDRITIFKKPILELSEDPETIKQIIADTVWHEVGHHFGLSEAEVEAKEAERLARRHQAETE